MAVIMFPARCQAEYLPYAPELYVRLTHARHGHSASGLLKTASRK